MKTKRARSEPVKKMMEAVMTGMMKPEDLPRMMDRMLSAMSAEDRVQFVTTMMPKCLNTVLGQLSPEAKEKLAREMMDKMTSAFQVHLGVG